MLLAAVALRLCQEPLALRLRAVEGAGEAAVEGAEVRWIPFGTHALDLYGPDPLPYSILVRDDLYSVEPVARTGADGRARLAPSEFSGVLCVSEAGRRGCAPWTPNVHEEVRVQLFRDWPLDADVVDPTGASLDGLGVCLRFATEGETGYRDVPVTRVPIRSGRAHIQHAGFLQSSNAAGGACYAALTGWIGPPVQTWIPREEPPFDRVLLRVPPHGSLVLRILDEEGRPAHAMDPACLGALGRVPRLVAWPQDPGGGLLAGGPGFVARAIDGDRVVFRHVAVGAKLEACARRTPASAVSAHACSGPRVSGEVAETELQLGEGCVTLRGSVLVPPGTSILLASLAEAGPFTIDLDEAGVRLLDNELAFFAGSRDGHLSAGSYTWWPEGWKKGLNEVGELRLEDPPCVVTGTVALAGTHTPVGAVEVVMSDRSDPARSGRTVTAQDGGFRLCGYPQTRNCSVLFRWQTPDGQTREVTRTLRRGTRDVRVELE